MADFPVSASPAFSGAPKRLSRNESFSATVLLVTKEPASFQGLYGVGQAYSCHLESVSCGIEATECMEKGLAPDVVLLDVFPGDSESLHTLRRLRRLRPSLPVLLLSSEEDGRALMQHPDVRPDGWIVKPWTASELEKALRRHMRRQATNPEAVSPAADDIEVLGEDLCYVAASRAMRALRARAETLAQTDVPIVIAGEAGSGREATARLIHKLSIRSPFPFLKSNCAALPLDLLGRELLGYELAALRGAPEVKAGKLEFANNGTLLLEELESLPQALQAKLFPILQNGQFFRQGGKSPVRTDVRLLATITISSEEKDVSEQHARVEVAGCFSKYVLEVPSLRERAEDIPLLLGNFMTRLAKRYGLRVRQISSKALDSCQRYSWPGNLPELENFVKRYLIMGDDCLASNEWQSHAAWRGPTRVQRLEEEIPGGNGKGTNDTSLKSLVRSAKGEAEKSAITQALQQTRWNRKAAARSLGISYRALLYKIQEYHMTPPDPSIVLINHRAKVGRET
jgi:two-component system, NtrC family, response regulator AtoC